MSRSAVSLAGNSRFSMSFKKDHDDSQYGSGDNELNVIEIQEDDDII